MITAILDNLGFYLLGQFLYITTDPMMEVGRSGDICQTRKSGACGDSGAGLGIS